MARATPTAPFACSTSPAEISASRRSLPSRPIARLSSTAWTPATSWPSTSRGMPTRSRALCIGSSTCSRPLWTKVTAVRPFLPMCRQQTSRSALASCTTSPTSSSARTSCGCCSHARRGHRRRQLLGLCRRSAPGKKSSRRHGARRGGAALRGLLDTLIRTGGLPPGLARGGAVPLLPQLRRGRGFAARGGGVRRCRRGRALLRRRPRREPESLPHPSPALAAARDGDGAFSARAAHG